MRSVAAPRVETVTAPDGWKRSKPPIATTAAPQQPSERERLLQAAAAAPPDTMIDVYLGFDPLPIDWATFKTLDDTARPAFAAAQRGAHEQAHAGVRKWLASIGATHMRTYWLMNGVGAKIPARHVASAVAQPGVRNAHGAEPVQPLAWETSLAKRSSAIRTTSIYNAGYTGATGGRATNGGRIRLAIIESQFKDQPPNYLYRDHAGFKRPAWQGGGSRIRAAYDCTVVGPGGTCTAPLPQPTGSTHGTRVTFTAAGSIEGGQDSNYPLDFWGYTTVDQENRSGFSKGADILYYYFGGTTTYAADAVNAAVQDGADVINMSFGSATNDPSTWCQRRDALYPGLFASALNAGAVLVAGAGNVYSEGSCTLGWPAIRPEVLSIGALLPVDGVTDYAALPMWSQSTEASCSPYACEAGSARGGVPITLYAGGATYISGIDLVAPGAFFWPYMPPGNSYDNGAYIGTSISAPTVSALAGLIRGAMYARGWGYKDARQVMVATLLMGDAWRASTVPANGGVDWRSGAGRVRGHVPDNADMGTGWGWGLRVQTLYAGQAPVEWPVWTTGPEASTVKQWKWAVTFLPSDMNQVPDIDFYVVDKCAGGAVLAYDNGYDFRSRFKLTNVANRCLYMRAVPYAVPASGVTFYSAELFHSQSTAEY